MAAAALAGMVLPATPQKIPDPPALLGYMPKIHHLAPIVEPLPLLSEGGLLKFAQPRAAIGTRKTSPGTLLLVITMALEVEARGPQETVLIPGDQIHLQVPSSSNLSSSNNSHSLKEQQGSSSVQEVQPKLGDSLALRHQMEPHMVNSSVHSHSSKHCSRANFLSPLVVDHSLLQCLHLLGQRSSSSSLARPLH